MKQITLLFMAILSTTFFAPSSSSAKVKAVSTDGEATIYLRGDFTSVFDLAYKVTFDPAPSNRSWTSVSLLLLSGAQPSSAVSLGLVRGYPTPESLSAFTTSSLLRMPSKYTSFPVGCSLTCTIELRGDLANVSALVDGRTIGVWRRSEFTIVKPYVQINGEVSVTGDHISARLFPVQAVAGGKDLQQPLCAFTTQGVEARAIGAGALEFSGARTVNARVTYVSLVNGSTGDSCPLE